MAYEYGGLAKNISHQLRGRYTYLPSMPTSWHQAPVVGIMWSNHELRDFQRESAKAQWT